MPEGAHLFELPNKIVMRQDDYFMVQRVYAGWALFAVPIVAAIAANGILFLSLRRGADPAAAHAALASALLICLTLVIFFIWVFPHIAQRRTGPSFQQTGKR